jgi:hypothetical protein
VREPDNRAQTLETEPGQCERVARYAKRPEELGDQCIRVLDERPHQPAIPACVDPETICGFVD